MSLADVSVEIYQCNPAYLRGRLAFGDGVARDIMPAGHPDTAHWLRGYDDQAASRAVPLPQGPCQRCAVLDRYKSIGGLYDQFRELQAAAGAVLASYQKLVSDEFDGHPLYNAHQPQITRLRELLK